MIMHRVCTHSVLSHRHLSFRDVDSHKNYVVSVFSREDVEIRSTAIVKFQQRVSLLSRYGNGLY